MPASSSEPALAATPGLFDWLVLVVAIAIVAAFVGSKCHRLRRAPAKPPGLTALACFSLVLLMLAAASLAAAGARMLWARVEPAATQPDGGAGAGLGGMVAIAAAALMAQAIVGVVYLVMLKRGGRPNLSGAERARSRPFSATRSVAIGAITVLAAWPCLTAASMLAAWWLGAPPRAIAHETLHELMQAPADGWWVAMVVLVVVGAPLMEELTYRGLVQTGLVLAGLPRWPAIVMTSAGFAYMHWSVVEPEALAALFVLSIALGWAYERTGRLAAPIAMHVLFNGANLSLALVLA